MAKQKKSKTQSGFGKIRKQRQQETGKETEVTAQIQTVIKQNKKQGRPTSKDPSRKYVKFGGLISKETKDRMKLALLTTCKDNHTTQEELIDAAINFYLDGLEGKG